MALSLLTYKPSSQNQRVKSFGVADLNEDTPYIYRLEDAASPYELKELIWAGYRQVFSEHEILKFNRQIAVETRLANRSITVRDFIRELAKSEAFYRLVVSVNNNYRLVQICLKRFLGRTSYNQDEEIAWSIVIATKGLAVLWMHWLIAMSIPQRLGISLYPTNASGWRRVRSIW